MASAHAELHARLYGFDKPYAPMLALMHELHEQVVKKNLPAQLMLLEHEPVITITRQHLMRSLKSSEEEILKDNISIYMADRGGDATFHGPGQLVGYPLIHVSDIESLVRGLEQALFDALSYLGLKNIFVQKGFTGIWWKDPHNKKVELKKLVAIGIGVKNGVSKHGFALNISIDHQPFIKHMIPCGLKDRGVITLKEAFFYESLFLPDYLVIVQTVAQSIAQIFSYTLRWHEHRTKELLREAYPHG